MSSMPQAGDQAPDFTLPAGDGSTVSLANLKGQKTVLYFYPKDDTPGCTKEACGFRDLNSEIRDAGAQILGISADNVESHRKFAEKNNLNFPLLADVDKETVQDYGVWQERNIRGNTSMGIVRTTFLIDENGKVEHVWKVSDAELHGQEVLDWLKSH
jgi:thioredoxin-dependent peroxiredoxin